MTLRFRVRPARALLTAGALCFAAFAVTMSACAPNPLTCEDLLPPGEASFKALAPMLTGANAKGCAQCHNTTNPVYGLNFEGPAVSYDALVSRIGPIYDQLETGRMPQGGERWNEHDLRLLRSWYCQGAVYEAP